MQKPKPITIKTPDGKEFSQPRRAVAEVDTSLCINCGKCRYACPTDTIDEYQRDICRLCTVCGDSTVDTPQYPEESKRYAVEHSCSFACPLGTVPEGYVNLVAEGRLEAAYELIRDLNPLPSVCSMICHHPCEDECKRGLLIDRPIAIRALKRYVTESIEAPELKFNRKFDRKVAIIGAGPAGLTAAADLARKGYRVKIFEAGPGPGGMMLKGIPAFRLDKAAMLEEIQQLLDAGIEIEYNCMVGRKPSVQDLLDDKYEAVLIATGAPKGGKLDIPGAEAEQVYDAISFMNRVNTGQAVDVGERAVVIGGGSVAMDAARALLRMGVDDVSCAFVETCNPDKETDVLAPAPVWEIEEAMDEGVEIIESVMPLRIVTDWFTVQGVELQQVACVLDDKGAFAPEGIEGSNTIVEADTVIFATGQQPSLRVLAKEAGLDIDDKGFVNYDADTFATSNEHVFIAGDASTAKGSVVDAMAAGRKAALAIDNMLQGRELVSRIHAKEAVIAPAGEKIYPATHIDLGEPRYPSMDRFRDSFEMVEGVFDDLSAIREAHRCMKCGYSGVDNAQCIGCGMCAEICPENAITMVEVK